MKYFITLSLLFVLGVHTIKGQELLMNVQVTYPSLTTADPQTLESLEIAIREFFNNTKWTTDDFEDEEKIIGSVQINVRNDPSANVFVVDLYISASRPVYNSTYTAPILNHVEKNIRIRYDEQTPLRDNAKRYTDNLSALLTFYAYIIIGHDYDTFSPMGGEPYFNIAQQILSSVPASAGDQSWTNDRGHSRYTLIKNILNPRVAKMRQATYDYHRNGLDKLESDIGLSKAVILSAIKSIGQVSDSYRNAMIVQMWSNAKTPEIAEIFKNSVKSEQRQVYKIMTSIDPSKADDLRSFR